MANSVKIKRGSGVPSGSDLAVYELGYRTGTAELYINDDGQYRQVGGASGGGAVDSIANFADNRLLTESDADSINGEANLTFDGTDLAIAATGKIYFDGGGNSYVHESSGDQVDFVIGGTQIMRLYEGGTDYVKLDDNVQFHLGTGNDLKMYHNSSSGNNNIENHNGSLYITNEVDDTDIIFRNDDGSGGVENYMQMDGSAGRTLFNKPIRVNDDVEVQVGSSADLKFYHNATNSFIANNTGNLYIRNNHDDGQIIFQTDDGSGGYTTYFNIKGNDGLSRFLKNVRANDSIQIQVGSSNDANFKHDGSNTYLTNATGNLFINQTVDDGDIILKSDDGSGGVTAYLTLDGSAENLNFHNKALVAIGGLYGNSNTLNMYANTYYFKNSSGSVLGSLSGSTLDIPNSGDWSYILNNTNSGGLRLGTKDSGGTLAYQIELSNTGNYVKLNENTSVTGYSGATEHFQLNFSGTSNSLLKIVNSGWSNETTHDILFNYWQSNIGDYTYLKSAGNSTSGHGIALVGDTLFAVGDTTVATGAVTNSATAPFTDTWFYVNGSGHGWFKGNVTTSAHLVLPYGEINDSGTDLNIVGTNAITLQSESGTALTIPNASTNVILEGELFLKDGKDLVLGNDSDIELKFDGSHGYFKNATGDLYIQQHANDKDIVFQCDDGSGNVSAYLTIDGGANKIIANENIDIVTSSDEMMRFKRSGADEVSIEQDSSQIYFYNRTTSKVMFLMSEGGNSRMGHNTNPVFELRNEGTSAGNGGSLTFGHSQDSSTTAMARISGYLVDGSSAGRAGHLRFWTSRAGSDELAMQLQHDNKLRLYQAGDTSDYLEIYVDDTRAYYHHAHTGSSGAYNRFITDNGYIELGPANTGWGHINTDRAKFYFNKQVTVDSGVITAYDEDLSLQRNHDSANDSILIASSSIQHKLDGNVKLQINSDGRINYNGWTGVDHITVRSNGHTNSGSSNTFYVKFCTVVVDNSPANYNGVSLTGKIYRGDNGHGNWIDWSVWFNNGLDSAQIAHGGFMRSNGAHWISNILVQRTAGDGEIDNGSCTYELYYDINNNWANNFYNVATEVHYPSEGKFNVTWNHDQSEVTSLPGTQVVDLQTNTYDDGNQTLVQSGAVGAPSYSFLASRNTGMYRGASDTIDFTNGGTRMLTIQADGDLELRSDGSSQGAYIERVGGIKFTWDRDSYGTAVEHSIRSSSDNLIISSYDDVTINLDSNNNDSSETFDIRKHATSLTGGTLLFQVDGSGSAYSYGGYGTINGSASSPSFRFNSDSDTGMYRYDADTIGFSAGGAVRATINSSGVLYVTSKVQAGSNGIEVWDATHGFKQILGKDSTYTYLKNNDGNVMIHLGDSGDGNSYYNSGQHIFRNLDSSAEYLRITSGHISNTSGGDFHIRRDTSNDDMIEINASDTRIYGDADERMRIGSTIYAYKPFSFNSTQTWGGNITWNTGVNVLVAGESSFDVSGSGVWQVWDSGDGTHAIKMDVGQQVEIGAAGTRGLKVNGTLNATADVVAYTSSDKRLKDNLKPIKSSLDKVSKLSGYEFDWNDKQETYQGHDVGVVAQEVEEVMPEIVTTRDNGYKAVKYEKLVPLLIESIKELKEEIDGLKNKLGDKNG